MADTACLGVSEDLDALRRSLAVDSELTPHLARLLAACSGILRLRATAGDAMTENTAPTAGSPDDTPAEPAS